MVLPEPYFSLSDSRDTSCAIRFFSEPVPNLSLDSHKAWIYLQTFHQDTHLQNYLINLSKMTAPETEIFQGMFMISLSSIGLSVIKICDH